MIMYTGVLSDGFCIYKEIKEKIKKHVETMDSPVAGGFLKNALNQFADLWGVIF